MSIVKSAQNRAVMLILVGIIFGLNLLCFFSNNAAARELTLDQALDIAFAESPTMKRVGYALDMSRHNLQAQQASLKSQFQLTLKPYSYSKNRVFQDLLSQYNTQKQTESSAQFSISQPLKWTDGTLRVIEDISWRKASSSFSGDKEETTYSNSLYLSLSQPFFTYNRTKLNLKELELDLENAELNYSIQKLQIEQQVTQSFLNLFYLKRSVEISREELDNSTESYEIIKGKVEAGISAKEELFQADLTQANSRATVENKQMQYENALDNFRILLGLPLDEEIDIKTDIKKISVDVNLAKAINYGLANRMELRQKDIDIQNALNSLIRTGAQNEFKGSVDVTYGLIGTDAKFGDIYKSPAKNQSVSVNLNIPLFDWGRKKHQIESAKTQVASQRLSADEERKQISFEIRQSYRNLQNQKLQIDIARKNVKNAQLTYDINLEKYKNGDLSSKDLGFYQNQLSNEQLNEVQALINYQLAILEMKIRTLWDFQKNQPAVIRD